MDDVKFHHWERALRSRVLPHLERGSRGQEWVVRVSSPIQEAKLTIKDCIANGLNYSDTKGGKPWLDDATNAQWTFWDAADEWLPTWGEGDARGMTIKSIKMYSRGACGSSDSEL